MAVPLRNGSHRLTFCWRGWTNISITLRRWCSRRRSPNRARLSKATCPWRKSPPSILPGGNGSRSFPKLSPYCWGCSAASASMTASSSLRRAKQRRNLLPNSKRWPMPPGQRISSMSRCRATPSFATKASPMTMPSSLRWRWTKSQLKARPALRVCTK